MSSTCGLTVLLVAQAAPARGGIPSFVTNLMADEGFGSEVTFELLNTTRVAQRRAGRWTVGNSLNSVVDALVLARRARRADVVHIQTALLPLGPLVRAAALCRAARSAGAGVVLHVHSGRLNSGRPEAFRIGWAERFFLRRTGSTCDRVITVSRVGADVLRPLMGSVEVGHLHNAVDVGSFTPQPGPRVEEEACRVVYVGTLSRRKGLPELVEALDAVAARGALVELDVVGGAHEVGEAEAQEVLAHCRNARFPLRRRGSLDAAGVRRVLREADLFALPSHWEGQPIAILEAMATGLPVVVTTVGANPDIVRDGVDGRLVEPRDVGALTEALAEFVENPGLRGRVGGSARERVLAVADRPRLRGELVRVYRAVERRRSGVEPRPTTVSGQV